MGGAVSAGNNNDELVDNLVAAEYLKSHLLISVFRSVDRGEYYLPGCKESAYRDLAWKHGHIHLSAPCIYSEVMESLSLGPGMSFLNLGSGTGYLSTMAGLILGPFGTNHGVELHKDVVEYAKDKLDEFVQSSGAFDKFEFCAPTFVVGNCLLLDSSVQEYDRVYCGASCPAEHEMYMKNLIKIGGILVMPFNDHLLRITRTSQTTFDTKSVIPVSFAPLVVPVGKELQMSVKLPEFQTPRFTLQELCRFSLRAYLRRIIEMEHPTVNAELKIAPQRKAWVKKEVVLPRYVENRMTNGNASSTRQSDAVENDRDGTNGVGSSLEPSTYEPRPTTSRFIVDFADLRPLKHLAKCLEANGTDLDSATETDSECVEKKKSDCPRSVMVFDPESDTDCECIGKKKSNSSLMVFDPESDADYESIPKLKSNRETSIMVLDPPEIDSECVEKEKSNEETTATVDKEDKGQLGNGDSGIDNVSDDSFLEECSSDVEMEEMQILTSFRSAVAEYSEQRTRSMMKRSAEDDADSARPNHRSSGREGPRYPFCRGSNVIFKRVAFSDADSEDLDELSSDDSGPQTRRSSLVNSPKNLSVYFATMKHKISQLPLPVPLKRFMNHSRPMN